MVQRGREVQQEQRDGINAVTHDSLYLAFHRSRRDQHTTANKRERRAYQMTNAIESLAVVHGRRE